MKITFSILFLVLLLCSSIMKIIEFDLKYIIISMALLIILSYENDKNNDDFENFNNTEAIQNLASIYNTGKANFGEIEVNKLTVHGDAIIDGNIQTKLGKNIIFKGATDPDNAGIYTNSDGTLHLGGPKLLHLLNRGGVNIGKEWSGNGNVNIQGTASVGSTTTVDGDINMKLGKNIVFNGEGGNATDQAKIQTNTDGTLHLGGSKVLHLLNKEGVRVGTEWGGNGKLFVAGDTWLSGGVDIRGAFRPYRGGCFSRNSGGEGWNDNCNY